MASKPRRPGFTPAQTEAYRRAAQKPAGWMLETRLQEPSVFVPDAPASRPVLRRAKPERMPRRKLVAGKMDLSDGRIEGTRDFADEGGTVLLHDHGGTQSIPGLRIRLGKRSATWLYYRDVLDHGQRIITSKTLGRF